MNTLALTATIIAATTAGAHAQSLIDTLCGMDHENEVAAASDVVANPDGYYVTSLAEQISHGDPRLVMAVGDEFYLCTRPVAIPGMDTTTAMNSTGKRIAKYLFIPVIPPKPAPSS